MYSVGFFLTQFLLHFTILTGAPFPVKELLKKCYIIQPVEECTFFDTLYI